jgi:hypothetical protein
MAQGSGVTSAIETKCYRICAEAMKMNPTKRPSISFTLPKCYAAPSRLFPLFLFSLLAVLLTLTLVAICFASDKRFWLVNAEKRNAGGNIGVDEKWRSFSPRRLAGLLFPSSRVQTRPKPLDF